MRRASLSTILVLALTACDPKGDAVSTAENSSEGAPRLSPPEPVSLHRPSRTSTWTPDQTPAASSLAGYAPGAASEDLTALAGDGARFFDGAGQRRIVRRGGMTIDTDGEISDPAAFRAVAARDRWRQNETSLRYASGRSLDPTRVPFIVLPLGFQGARLGDLVYVEYNGRGVWAIAGDYGPRHRFGEGSSALAAALGINPSGYDGGVRSGVTYTIFPGTSNGRQPNEAALLAHLRTTSAALGAGPTMLAANDRR